MTQRIWTMERAWHLDAEMAALDALREAVAFLEAELDRSECAGIDETEEIRHAFARLRRALSARERRLAIGP